MKVCPVTRHAEPDFPTRTIVDEHPELLAALPERWRGNPVVVAALLGGCIILSGCRRENAKAVPSNVAPIFVHGEGRGSFGCVAVSPPVFLSEAEAQQVINEEAKRAGIHFSTKGASAVKLHGPATDPYSHGKPVKTQLMELRMDGTDAKRRISYEFASRDDFDAWESRGLLGWLTGVSSAGFRDVKDAANVLREGLAERKPDGTYAVFYDPGIRRGDAEAKLNKGKPVQDPYSTAYQQKVAGVAKDMSLEQLRAQVRDFIKWLKSEGVI